MARSKSLQSSLPKNRDELIEFFDSHDMGDYWDHLPEAHFEVEIKKRTHLIAIDESLANKITAIAKAKKTSSESLVNTWLKKSVQEVR